MNENKDLLPNEDSNENTSPTPSENQEGNVAFSEEESVNKEKIESAEENNEDQPTEDSEKEEKKKKRLFLIIAIIVGLMVFVGAMFIHSKNDHSEADDVTPIDYMQYVTGIDDLTVLKEAKDVDFMKNIAWDEAYINGITCDSSKVDLSKVGTYEVTYMIDIKDEKEEDLTKKVKVIVSEDKKAVESAEKEAEAKQEEAKNNTASSSNSSSSTNSGNNNPSSSSSNNSSSSSSGNSGSKGNNSSSNKPTTPTHTHNWIPVTKTVYHDEVGHYENVCVEEAWDEGIYEMRTICNCGADITGNAGEHSEQHILKGEPSAYKVEKVKTGTIHHDAVYENQWVVDQAAWTETITTGYKCSCGATK